MSLVPASCDGRIRSSLAEDIHFPPIHRLRRLYNSIVLSEAGSPEANVLGWGSFGSIDQTIPQVGRLTPMPCSVAKHFVCLVSSSGDQISKRLALFSSNITNGSCTTMHIYHSSPCKQLRACDREYIRRCRIFRPWAIALSVGVTCRKGRLCCGRGASQTKITGNIRFRVREPQLW
jgi:hypothetical protein